MGLASRLYRGETEFPLIQRRKTFYIVSVVLVLICLGSMLFRGFNVGEEFKGGASFSWPAGSTSVVQARSAIEGLGVSDPTVQTVGSSNGATDLRVTTGPLTDNKIDEVIDGISTKFHVDKNNINNANVGASWGKQVTKKALQGLVLFLIAVIIYISIRFEPKMAAAAIVALIHDLILTAGIYSITHFVVTPATVIALLTVLGYSLYDTIVVFDKVEENTRGLAGRSTQTYSEAAELAVNQTFMRSINTSLIALLPVSGLLFVGAFLLGAGTLKDLALALFVGLASGAYSSLFLATPLLADLKEREPQYQALQQRVLARRSGTAVKGSKFQQRAAARATGTSTPTPVAAEPVVIEDAAGPAAVVTPSKAPAGAAGRRPGGSSSKNKKKSKGGRPSGKKRR
ncbi:MAG: preprotein translocase subunit SecF [Actinomycetota bacterium]|jgi:preprotein translocase subunit SecF|nr:preprotein translocase subunit SecF [Actinomycetota bacterium]